MAPHFPKTDHMK